MKKLFLTAVTVLFILAGCSSDVSSDANAQEIPAEIKERADAFIMTRTSIEYFRSYFKLDEKLSKLDTPYYSLAYRYQIPEKPFVDERVVIIIDTAGNISEKGSLPGIPVCVRDSAFCSFNIDEKGAIKIAEENGIGKGMKLKAEFKWDEKYSAYIWEVLSVEESSEGTHGFRGRGEKILIDPNSGSVLDVSEWFVR
jgi:hypothetical protein